MKTDILNCERCGGPHLGVELVPLTQPVCYLGLPIATHFAPCPTNHEPVLVKVWVAQPEQVKR